MEPIIAVATILAALAAAGGLVHSYQEMRASQDAESHLRSLLLRDAKLRSEVLAALSKRSVGDQTLDSLEARLSHLLVQLPKDQQPRVRAALKQRSRRGQRDYMFKLAADDLRKSH